MTLPISTISIQDLVDEAGGGGGNSTVSVLFTASTTWDVPAGVTSVKMTAIGGGGGGGGCSFDGDSHAGGAGGPGGVDVNNTVAVTPGDTLFIQVGQGGTAASTLGLTVCPGNGTVNGGNGGTSRVYRVAAPGTDLVIATGGYGGNGGIGDNPAATDANHSNGGSGNAGTPSVTGNPPRPVPFRNSYFYTEGHGNTTRFGAGGDGNGLAVGVSCPTPGGQGAVMISYVSTGGGGGSGNALGDYYAGGGIVPNPPPTSLYQTSPIPTSGPIELGSFRGVTIIGINDFVDQNVADSMKTTGYNVVTRATALGWDGVSPLNMRITIVLGTVLYRTNPGYTFTLPAGLPAGSQIELVNNGAIVGMGGDGGPGGDVSGPGTGPSFTNGGAGGAGSPAMSIAWPITITNNGLIAGGGGGGGGGASAYVYYDDAFGGGGGGGA